MKLHLTTESGLGTVKVTFTVGGYVGIGTTSPTEKLEVTGAIKIGDTNTASLGTIKYDPNELSYMDMLENNGVTQWVNLSYR